MEVLQASRFTLHASRQEDFGSSRDERFLRVIGEALLSRSEEPEA